MFYAVSAIQNSSGKVRKNIDAGVATPVMFANSGLVSNLSVSLVILAPQFVCYSSSNELHRDAEKLLSCLNRKSLTLSASPTKAELQEEVATLRAKNEYLEKSLLDSRAQKKGNAIVAVLNPAIFWVGACYLATMVYLSVRELAGKTTLANMGLVADVSIGSIAQGVVTVIAIVYGYKQKTLRQKTVAEMGARVEEVETRIDPTRTSSGLTRIGTTNPEDR